MDQVHVIRHKVLVEGQSARSVSKQLGISRNTVRKYLKVSEPIRKQSEPRIRPVLGKVAPEIDQILDDWKNRLTPKQRITGTLVHEELLARGHQAGISTVRAYLAERRRAASEVFIPLHYVAGDCAQVDFFEVVVEIDGVRRKAWKFLVRLMHSGRDFAWLYERCDQVAFLDGHVRAFAHFGGLPARMIYDNLKAAVKRRLGLDITLAGRFQALVSHYLFEPCFARPGEGHDKGGVESRGKSIRLQHLTPIPRGQSLAEVSQQLMADLDRTMETRRNAEGQSVAERWAQESRRLRPLPSAEFEPRLTATVQVSRQAMVLVAGTRYSVPSHWKSLRASAYIGTDDVRLVCGTETVVLPLEHSKKRVVRYRHYFEELAKKPQAVRQVSAPLLEELGEPFGRLWEMLVARYSEREAARLLSRLLGAMVDQGETTVAEVIHEALERGDLDSLVLPQLTRRYRRWMSRRALAGSRSKRHRLRTSTKSSRRSTMADAVLHAVLEQQLALLRMPTVRRELEAVTRRAQDGTWSYEEFLRELLDAELSVREQRGAERRLREARFPDIKTLDQIDWKALQGVSKTKLLALSSGDFLDQSEDIVLAGPVGTGKTHLAIALGVEMARRGRRVLFTRAADLVQQLVEARDSRDLLTLRRKLLRVQLLIVDELGFVPFDRVGGELLFNLFSERYERKSTLVTTNLAFSEWVRVFGDEKLTVALLDRLSHHAHILTTKGKSFRRRRQTQEPEG